MVKKRDLFKKQYEKKMNKDVDESHLRIFSSPLTVNML